MTPGAAAAVGFLCGFAAGIAAGVTLSVLGLLRLAFGLARLGRRLREAREARGA